jgi:hypothetical protein
MSPNKERAYLAMVDALRHARDELQRLNASYNAVRPDVQSVVETALKAGTDNALNA